MQQSVFAEFPHSSRFVLGALIDDGVSDSDHSKHHGQHPQDAPDLLQGQGLQEAHAPQGHPVQEGQGLHLRAGEASLRPQAERLRWSDQARLPQEGEDDQEGRATTRVHLLQVQNAAPLEALQALRARW